MTGRSSTPTAALRHVVVAIPARDEEALLPSCLAAVSVAVRVLEDACPDVRVVVAVALDGCTDGSAAVAAEAGVALTTLTGVGVGLARDAAVARGLEVLGGPHGVTEATTWLACTDADTVVPPRWLVRQVRWADQGLDLVVGTAEPVGVDRPETLVAWHARHRLVEGHEHVHGANLGVRASRWREVGGFGDRRLGEDVHLVERVRAVSDHTVATDTTRVLTSGRSRSRVADGFAGYLGDLRALADRHDVDDPRTLETCTG